MNRYGDEGELTEGRKGRRGGTDNRTGESGRTDRNKTTRDGD